MTDDVLREDINILATLSMKLATAEKSQKHYRRALLVKHLEAMERRHGREETQFIMDDLMAVMQRDFGPLRKEESE